MVGVGNTGSTLKCKYFIAALASTQGFPLSIIPIIIKMTEHSFSTAHWSHFKHTKNHLNQSASKAHTSQHVVSSVLCMKDITHS